MYEELLDMTEVAGKTIAPQGIICSTLSGQMVIPFTDETFITLGIDTGYEVGDETMERQELDLEDFGQCTIIGSGIITLEEHHQKMKELSESRRQALCRPWR